ncbi:50S ribosomal protein L17 [Candidatus Nitrospira bockiana]
MFRNLVTLLLEHERIETTEAKAKEVRGFTDRMITLGKEGDLSARRRALGFLKNKAVVSKLFADVAGRFRDRNGGYTRIIKTRRRLGDAADMVAIELVVKGSEAEKTTQSPAADKKAAPSAAQA